MTTEKGKSETQLGKQPEEMGAEKEGEAAISQGLPCRQGHTKDDSPQSLQGGVCL